MQSRFISCIVQSQSSVRLDGPVSVCSRNIGGNKKDGFMYYMYVVETCNKKQAKLFLELRSYGSVSCRYVAKVVSTRSST